jgi:predicted ATPase/DNA-binding winged helix-turn-helix (wHTH) protein
MLRFDGCSLDLARREVRSGGQVQHLEPQAFDLLAYLVEHRGRVVPKEELLDRVWGDQFVSDAALTTRVKEVRRAIGDDGRRQRLVRNVRGRGYRFVGEIAQPAGQSPAGAAEPILGRAHDIAGVARLLSMSRLVTLVGAGGVGKTRLAVEVAAGTGAQAPDGAFFVDLSALASAQAVVPAILRSVDLQVEGDLAALRGLSALDALVVLDNCEHLIEPAAAAAQVVLGFGGRVRILATSRERLGVRGERVWPVSPLDVTAARQLFVDRARAVSPGFDPHSADATVVQRVVDEVDRLPLAIEMAAARVGAMGMAELAALVTTRLDLLRSPHRGTTDRHRTLAAVIAWSEGLLDDSERTAFAELSAFAGPALGADLDGVIDGGDALDRVCRLVERSLVIAEVSPGPTRYRMLETVRRHAAACAGNDEALRLRHATWFTETAEDADALLRTPAERKGHEAIEARVDELRAAHRWARSQAPHLAARLTAALQLHAHSRLWSEPAQWAVELAHIIDEDEPLASQVWAAMANAAAHQGRFEEGTSLAERALRSADPRAAAVALEALADIAMYQGDLSRCRSLGRRLQDVGGCAGDNHAVALGHVDEALALAYGTDPGAALDVLGRFERSGHAPSDQAWFHYAEGEAHARADPDLAVAAFEAAIELADGVGNRFLGGVARVSAASVYGRSADPDRALRAFPRLISDWQRRGNLTHLVTSLRNVTELFVRVGAHDAAAQLFGALHGRDLKGSYGDEARRLADARTSLERALGASLLQRSMAQGEGKDLYWASALALHTIEHLAPSADAATPGIT